MYGNQREDSLNYNLVMEGFYYDAEIEHIAEIVKNTLYFAVLEGENNKIIKNSHDAYYFTIDDELVYTNYYFDFGPLNISCVYKYCYKLNTYLQYSQGLKRVVHYTTANSIRRVNAAFLMGCFAVIYLKMEPKDIYQILLSTGGQFKPFVDASQGISQYTIRLLDCLLAIQKAMTFNFFNFNDFNVVEYDLHDKLQNGDMNWLLPRKFLAFIGPTDNELMNGHPPNFYIKYFLENDIKTVVRLNNKVYDASVFTDAGIDHHELFFPDGTVPTKHILLRFLELSESARAAIAVHCKAGLGRTGSLIGAYIIKHYHMTAHEAIAWMRICRPGSVIGQQQGWLEKIEGWLWRQGSHYRLQHFGEGDKIPHHKYGIYSREWPKEREKLIRHVQRRRLEAQARTRPGLESVMRADDSAPPRECSEYPAVSKKAVTKGHTTCQKLIQLKDDESRKVPKLMNKIQKSSQVLKLLNKPLSENKETYRIPDVSAHYMHQEELPVNKLKPKRVVNLTKCRERLNFEEECHVNKLNDFKLKRYINTSSPCELYGSEVRSKLDFSDDFRECRVSQMKFRRRNQSESRDQLGERRLSDRIRRHFVENLEQTQGDKLNEIKARRFATCIESEGSANKIKQVKPRRRLLHVDVYGKPKASTSKKQELDILPPPKRSHFEHLYSPRA